MNVAILVKEFPPDVIGGTETQTQRLARHIYDSGHNVTIYTKSYSSSSDLNEPYHIKRVPTWHVTPFVSTLTFVLFATVALLRDHRQYDLLQCMMIYPNGFVGQVVNRIRCLPYFAWIRGGDYYFMKDTPGKRWSIDRVLQDTLVLVQTERIAQDVRSEFPETNLTVLGNGVDIPEETADGDKLVFVGRLKEQKGVHVLLHAVDGHDEQLLIVGDGPERERLEALADRLNIDAEFVGEVNPAEVDHYLREGKAFVLPSIRGEGLPNAVLEAMAVSLPIVVTDTGGVADVVVDGETGFVVPPGDDDALEERILQLCTDDQLQTKMGTAAREWVIEHHSWENIIEKLETIYQRVIERPQS